MRLVKEKWLHPLEPGVYPRQRRPPSALCCYRLMHIFTAARLVAYCECMSLTTQLSFWAARIVSGLSENVTLGLGLATFAIQLFLCINLIRGVSKRSLSLLNSFLIGVAARIIFLLLFCITILLAFLLDLQETFFGFFRRLAILKFILATLFILYLTASFIIVRKCNNYIKKTQEVMLVTRQSPCHMNKPSRTPRHNSNTSSEARRYERQCCLDTLGEVTGNGHIPSAAPIYPQYYAPLPLLTRCHGLVKLISCDDSPVQS